MAKELRKPLNKIHLHLIAIIAMTIDHVTWLLFYGILHWGVIIIALIPLSLYNGQKEQECKSDQSDEILLLYFLSIAFFNYWNNRIIYIKSIWNE